VFVVVRTLEKTLIAYSLTEAELNIKQMAAISVRRTARPRSTAKF